MIRIVIVDDLNLVREAVAFTLEIEKDIQVMGQGATAGDAVRLTEEFHPDILILDINMHGDGLTPAFTVSTSFPGTKVLVLTGFLDTEFIHAAKKAGVCAYVHKGVSRVELLEVIRGIQVGNRFDAPILPRGV